MYSLVLGHLGVLSSVSQSVSSLILGNDIYLFET
jgi:hypothetical protein